MSTATFKAPWIEAGALVRGQLRHVFSEVERNGGTARYYEDKGFFESVFTNVRLEGPEQLIRWANATIQSLCED